MSRWLWDITSPPVNRKKKKNLPETSAGDAKCLSYSQQKTKSCHLASSLDWRIGALNASIINNTYLQWCNQEGIDCCLVLQLPPKTQRHYLKADPATERLLTAIFSSSTHRQAAFLQECPSVDTRERRQEEKRPLCDLQLMLRRSGHTDTWKEQINQCVI